MKKCPRCGNLKFDLILYNAITEQQVELNSEGNVEFSCPVVTTYEDQQLECSECDKVVAVGKEKIDKFIWGH